MLYPQSHGSGGHRQFFWLSLSHDDLASMFKANFALMQYHKYGLAELENMVPWEREIYLSLLIQHLREEKEKQRMLEKQRGITHG